MNRLDDTSALTPGSMDRVHWGAGTKLHARRGFGVPPRAGAYKHGENESQSRPSSSGLTSNPQSGKGAGGCGPLRNM